eukprot:TRINITY_DN49264_c0_g1_i1.p1 TRINITY_DN49264_c0_g1~~TRINITY_DN49264_c0_g1_i1.p1  ORF type:complete len:291 (+),score=49.10 TRINITY_DN49264_c0_g1_i1:162-1034(+)
MTSPDTEADDTVKVYTKTTTGATIEWNLTPGARSNGCVKFLMRDGLFLPSGTPKTITYTKAALERLSDAIGSGGDDIEFLSSVVKEVAQRDQISCRVLQEDLTAGKKLLVTCLDIDASLDTVSHFFWVMKYERLKDNIFPTGYRCVAKYSEDEVINYMTYPAMGPNDTERDRVVHNKIFRSSKRHTVTTMSVESPKFPPVPGIEREEVTLVGYVMEEKRKATTRFVVISERAIIDEKALQTEANRWIDHLAELRMMCETGVIPKGPRAIEREQAASKRKDTSCCWCACLG